METTTPFDALSNSKVSSLRWNNTVSLEDIPLDSNLAWLLCSLFFAITWVVYITYYNSRVIGYIVTKIVNRFFIKHGYMKVGSLSLSVLSGKVMFRDVAYINEDFTIRTQDGWMIFRWWRPYVPKKLDEDLSHSETRLLILLNGFELHIYNRSHLYSRLEQVFGLEPRIIPPGSEPYWQDSGAGDGDSDSPSDGNSNQKQVKGYEWRDLIPVIKVDISTGRVAFGNHLLPTTLSITFEEGHIVYTTRPAPSRLDLFTHIAKCKAESFKVILAPSPKYLGLTDEPPRFMGEGFVVFQSNMLDLYYYQDEAGVVSAEPEMVELANGDIVQRSTVPCWGLDIKCGKGTDFSYGPWADRQREHLYKFFFPQDYQPIPVTKRPQIGEKRIVEGFDIRLSTLADATIDILFSKNKETNAIHMNAGPGSYLEVTIPWVTNEQGYKTQINGQLLHLDASTSLQYRSLVECETLEFDIRVHYPRVWNDYQDWVCNLTGCKASVNLIYAHKGFFQALIEDWSSKSRPDLLHFVPYTWHFNLILKEFELITVTNEHNWIDCSSQHQENTHLAVCGELFDMSFDLPFVEFLPPTLTLKFWIQGESVDMHMYLPESHTNRNIVHMLQKTAKLTNRDGSLKTSEDKERKWRNVVKRSAGWVDCWSVPIVALSITYTYHPMTPIDTNYIDLEITTPEREEILLSPMRPNGKMRKQKAPPENFDPSSLPPDVVSIELEVGPSVMCLYGSLLLQLLHIKENYVGECQQFYDFDSTSILASVSGHSETSDTDDEDAKDFDPRTTRPLDVTVSVTMHDIQGHIMKSCTEQDPPCPCLYLERFGFEMCKSYHETKLQLLLSPLILSATDLLERPESQTHLKDGHLALASLQVRGHAMFSNVDRPLESETLEYAWLVEVQLGDITGRLTIPQLYHVVTSLETFAFQVQQSDCALQPPSPYQHCQHDILQSHCPYSTTEQLCPSPEDLKYRMTRLAVDSVDVCIVESGTAVCLEVYPVRLATCNLHSIQTSSGLTAVMGHVHLRQYVLTCSTIMSASMNASTMQSEQWLEVGSVCLGPIHADAATLSSTAYPSAMQDRFLKTHDDKTKRLWFLWDPEIKGIPQNVVGRCGCVGGCAFFGTNRSGINFFHFHAGEEKSDAGSLHYYVIQDEDLGFGESLLHKGEFVFDVPTKATSQKGGVSPVPSDISFTFVDHSSNLVPQKTPVTTPTKSTDRLSLYAKSASPSQEELTEGTVPSQMTDTTKTTDDSVCTVVLNEKYRTWNSSSTTNLMHSDKDVYFSPRGRRIMRQFSSPTRSTFTRISTSCSPPTHCGPSLSVSFCSKSAEFQLSGKGRSFSEDGKVSAASVGVGTFPVSQEDGIGGEYRRARQSSRTSLNGWPTLHTEQSSLQQASSSKGPSPRSVRRAVSTESSHSSDAYYSADEENGNSNGSQDNNGAKSESEKMNKMPPRIVGGSSLERRVARGNRRSLQDIKEQPSLQDDNEPQLSSSTSQSHSSDATHPDPSDSNSVSSTSFISAMSSQEDIALVDLHNQMEKPIIDSPLLMSCYMTHLAQHQCVHWDEPPPLPHLTPQASLSLSGPNKDYLFLRSATRWKPRFTPLTEGFSSIHLVDKNRPTGHSWHCPREQKTFSGYGCSLEEDLLCGHMHNEESKSADKLQNEIDENGVDKTTLMIKFQGDVEVLVSPLMMESLKSFVDSLTPTVSALHPLTVVNHLHVLCSREVESHNQLKKEKMLYLSQMKARAARAARKDSKKGVGNSGYTPTNAGEAMKTGCSYEETRLSQLQVYTHIARVNIFVIQASIVEEVISFSALDNLKDLTCVSVLVMSLESLSLHLFHSQKAQRAIHTLVESSTDSSLHRKVSDRSSKKSRTDWFPTEPRTMETSETQQQEVVASVSLACFHIQLRRLKNSSSILKEAVLTVIPYNQSKVGFVLEKVSSRLPGSLERQESICADQEFDPLGDDDKMGFIMFECGLEDIGIKLVKKEGFDGEESESETQHPILAITGVDNKDQINTSAPFIERTPSKTSRKSDTSATQDAKPSSCVSECGSNATSAEEKDTAETLRGDCLSCVMELKTVWFNFAAPPRTPNTRKIDFTRLDWHLLSSATPSINAWLKAGDRFLVSFRKMSRHSKQRICAVMGCLMALALEVPDIHMPVKSKYTAVKLTPLARTLQEDPSCQLLTVLRRYLKMTEISTVEENLRSEFLPSLRDMQRGLVALSRQWKNVLYMPLLVEQNMKLYRGFRPMNVSFTVPLGDRMQPSHGEEGEKTSLEECDVTDETTNLLMAEGGSVARTVNAKAFHNAGHEISNVVGNKAHSSPEGLSGSSSGHQDATEEGVSSGSLPKIAKKALPSYPPRSSRASVAFPLLGGPLESPARYAGPTNANVVSKLYSLAFPQQGHSNSLRAQRNGSHPSLKSNSWSISSIEPNVPSSAYGTPKRDPGDSDEHQGDEDLYRWMARQQDGMRVGDSSLPYQSVRSKEQESKMNTLTSMNSIEGAVLDMPTASAGVAFVPSTLQLGDAHVIFQPLLSSLGVPSQVTGSAFALKMGAQVTVSGHAELLKVDIVESDYTTNSRHKRTQRKHNSTNNKAAQQQQQQHQSKIYIDTSMDTPAFICDKLCLEMDLRDVRDFEKSDDVASVNEVRLSQGTVLIAPDGLKQSTSVVSFSINISTIAQQVNLPLLRLLHQFSTMYENVKETRLEMKANRPSSFKEGFRAQQKMSAASADSRLETCHPQSPRASNKPTTTPTPTKSSSGGVSGLTAGIRLSQRFRPSTKGYTNLQEVSFKDEYSSSPLSANLSESVAIDIPDSCSIQASEPTLLEDVKDLQPRCWRTMFYLLDLYDTMPETKTITDRSSVPVAIESKSPDVSESYKGNGRYEPLKEQCIDVDEPDNTTHVGEIHREISHHILQKRALSIHDHNKKITHAFVFREWTPLVVFGVVRIRQTRLLAMLSGLKLEGELSSFHVSLTHKEKMKGTSRRWNESSLTGQLGQTMVMLLEGVVPNQQTVVKMMVGKSQTLYSSQNKKGKDCNSALLTIGPVNIDIPQHPVVLHGMMTRSSKQISNTLQELRSSRQPSRTSRPVDEAGVTGTTYSPLPPKDTSCPSYKAAVVNQQLIKPIVIQFSVILDSLTIGAALLPSLRAQYHMGQVTSSGVTGNKAKFTVDLPQHTLSFNTKVSQSETNLPSSASVDLPPVHISAEYIDSTGAATAATRSDSFMDGIVLRQGSYLNALAEIGAFEHSLTTDLLNHLLLVQKVFMKEVNEVVQKMSGVDKAPSLFGEEDKTQSLRTTRLLFSLQLRLKGIQITATTPTSSAVRLETGTVELQLSNRVQNMSSSGANSGNYMKLFGKVQVDLNLALGQLIKNALFEEAEPEFQQLAYFKTRIGMRNALQDELISSQSDDKEAVLITLNRPLIYIQPVALDKAVLVWLNYKNAYEYWNEQRAGLNKEVLTATQQVLGRVPQISQLSTQALGTLFLQLTVDDMGICLPLSPHQGNLNTSKLYDSELKAAVVVTLESTRISACSCGSLVSKGKFTGLCLRFADDFETSLDDWKPDPNDTSIMNLCVVSEGTYELCSRTKTSQGGGDAKWILNVQWQMEGFDIHVDTSIGKQLSALFKTLTALTGEEDETDGMDYGSTRSDQQSGRMPSVQEPVCLRKGSVMLDSLSSSWMDPTLDAKKRSRLIEKEMNEQAKIINDLKLLGASQSTIEQEVRRLHELETAIFNDFRRDVMKKLRRQSVKATSIRDKLGLGTKAHLNSRSFYFSGGEKKKSLVNIAQTPSSSESSPSHSHTRTASLDIADLPTMSLPDKPMYRELSLDSVFSPTTTADPGFSETPTSSHSTDGATGPVPSSSSTYNLGSLGFSDSSPNDEHDIALPDSNRASGEGKKPGHTTPGGASSGVSSFKQHQPEPNIDFELDIKVFFNSGKCVLHTKDPSKEEDPNVKRLMRKERSFSGGLFDAPSPSHSRRRTPGVRSNLSTSRLRFMQMPTAGQIADFTIFLIPGLDVKVHYNSKTVSGDSPVGSTACGLRTSGLGDPQDVTSGNFALEQGQTILGSSKKSGVKKASLFAWMTLQSIPEETVISPHILDFLEQALEPIPMPVTKTPPSAGPAGVFGNLKADGGDTAMPTPAQYAYASFPVDVIVYFRMQPSILRFSCLPVSRVECLLRLPSVDFVFSSKRADDEIPNPTTQHTEQQPATSKAKVIGRTRKESGTQADSGLTHQSAVGGLSMTGCLADFSLYIFHPYGGAKKSGGGKNIGRESDHSPLTTSERKDSLSLQVEFVKLNISRSRKINITQGEATVRSSKPGRGGEAGIAVIRFSTICDIGSALFKYDMRRLTEILAFPKAWYRRSIARRMFLGDQSLGAVASDQEDSSESSSSGTTSPTAGKSEVFAFPNVDHETSSMTSTQHPLSEPSEPNGFNAPPPPHGETFTPNPPSSTTDSPRMFHSHDSPGNVCPPPPFVRQESAGKDRLWLNLQEPSRSSKNTSSQLLSSSEQSSIHNGDQTDSKSSQHSSSPAHRQGSTWETLVLFAVNLSRLNVHMNMGNVMGNTSWLTRDFKAQGRLSVDSSGHKNFFMSLGLEGSTLDAKGGIVGGAIELSQIDTYMHLKEDWGQEPDHLIALKLRALESRLDYMGTSVLMGRVSALDLTLRDEWQANMDCHSETLLNHPTKRPALVFVHGDMSWDQLQLLLSKSTTADLVKMYSKLEEFFSQQFHSSKRVFSSLQPRFQRQSIKSTSRTKQPEAKPTSNVAETRHHRHWQKVLQLVSGVQLSTLPCLLPSHGTILGGTVELRGKNISLACFYGINFRSKAWAIFSMCEPTISFATEAQDVTNETGTVDTHIVQNLSFSLGQNAPEHAAHTSMATVCRISRNVLFPPQFRTMHEWFHYAFATSELDDVGRFPVLEHEKSGENSGSSPSERRSSMSLKGPEFNHNMEVIFAFPSMQLHLKTEHLQSAKTPTLSDPKPTVDCSFITDFDDHIFVAVDAEAYFFLHDLVTSYVREKDSNFSKSQSPDSERKRKVADPIEALQKDWRNYVCHTWHLEPTVRLLSWAGKGIEPYGVDYILQKLGFSHARVTIPKWIQRGWMDPLDKFLSVVIEWLIVTAKENKEKQQTKR